MQNQRKINKQSASTSYKAGYIAATHKKTVGDNPHDEHNDEHWRWMAGFTDSLAQLKP